jgi:hypothetical protein
MYIFNGWVGRSWKCFHLKPLSTVWHWKAGHGCIIQLWLVFLSYSVGRGNRSQMKALMLMMVNPWTGSTNNNKISDIWGQFILFPHQIITSENKYSSNRITSDFSPRFSEQKFQAFTMWIFTLTKNWKLPQNNLVQPIKLGRVVLVLSIR